MGYGMKIGLSRNRNSSKFEQNAWLSFEFALHKRMLQHLLSGNMIKTKLLNLLQQLIFLCNTILYQKPRKGVM